MLNSAHPYYRKTGVLTTKHRKLIQIGPIFEKIMGLHLVEEHCDTDQLGTFSGEIEREFDPHETAVRKARMGMAINGSSIGLGSEGSIGPDPLIPFLTSDIERIVLVDDERNLVISEVFRSFDITAARIIAFPHQDLTDFLTKANFPAHKLIVRPNTETITEATKGISSLTELQEAVSSCSMKAPLGNVVIESDLRAHNSPSRQRNIERVAELLAVRVSQLCPQCEVPGWGRVKYKKGLRCTACKSVVPEAVSREINGCVKCGFEEVGKVVAESADPAICPWCNP